MKVALVHDWLTGLRGGERVLLEFLHLYPNADIFTLLHVRDATDARIDARVRQASWIGDLPYAEKIYRHLLPLYPMAIRSLDLRGYDFIVSLSHAAAKNIKVPHGAKHLCYCFTPMRYIWDQAEHYFGWKRFPLSPVLSFLRSWDTLGSASISAFASISRFVSARIRCYYHRRSDVIFPPVRTSWIKAIDQYAPGEAYLYAGALVPYKKPDAVVHAFNELSEKLWVVGDGPMLDYLKAIARPNIEFLGPINDAELGELYARCRALVFPGVEDFGMIPVECMAAGRPVIGYPRGGLLDSVSALKHWRNDTLDPLKHTGVFIEPNGINLSDSIVSTVKIFEQYEERFDPMVCRVRAQMFSAQHFQAAWKHFEEHNA